MDIPPEEHEQRAWAERMAGDPPRHLLTSLATQEIHMPEYHTMTNEQLEHQLSLTLGAGARIGQIIRDTDQREQRIAEESQTELVELHDALLHHSAKNRALHNTTASSGRYALDMAISELSDSQRRLDHVLNRMEQTTMNRDKIREDGIQAFMMRLDSHRRLMHIKYEIALRHYQLQISQLH